MGEIKERLTKSVAGELKERMAIYSGHDTTIAPLLAAYGLLDEDWPPFASNIVIELLERASDWRLSLSITG